MRLAQRFVSWLAIFVMEMKDTSPTIKPMGSVKTLSVLRCNVPSRRPLDVVYFPSQLTITNIDGIYFIHISLNRQSVNPPVLAPISAAMSPVQSISK